MRPPGRLTPKGPGTLNIVELAMGGLGVVTITTAGLWLRHMVKTHGAAVLAWRYLSGHHLDGKHRTDAGWFERGTKPMTHNRRAGAWSHMPRAQRAGIRWAAFGGPVLALWLYFAHPLVGLTVLGVPVLGSLAGGSYWTARHLRRRAVHVDTLRPLYEAITPLTGHPPAEPAYNWISLKGVIDTPNPDDANGVLRIAFPREFSGASDLKTSVLRAAEVKLDVDLKASWKLAGRKPYAEFTRAPEPPTSAKLADLRPVVESMKQCNVYIGTGMSGTHIKHNFDRDAPHIAFSGGTGAGKSTFLGLTVAQLHRQGAEHSVLCDPKRGDSMPFLEGVDGITIYDTIAGMWHGIHWVREQMEYRFDNYTRKEAESLPPLVLVIDELNMFCDQSQEFWDEYAPKGARKTPPIYKDVRAIAFQGRSRRVFMIVAAQNFEGQLLGNAVRDQFGGKAMVRFSAKAWTSITGLGAKPRVSRLPGRGVWVIDDDVHSSQYLYEKPEGIRDFALERELPVTSDGPGDSVLVSDVLAVFGGVEMDQEPADAVGSDTAGARLHVVGPPEMYSLRQAAMDTGEGVIPLKLEALRRRRGRSDSFPEGVNHNGTLFFPVEELQEWWDAEDDTAAVASGQ